MFSSIWLLFGLVSISQYVTSFNKIGQNDDTNSMVLEPEEKISNVILKNKTSGSWFCGGNLINTAYILTAAECAVDRRPEDIIVYAGHRRLDQSDMIAHPIEEVIIHEGYDLRDPWRNNIALLRLMKSIDITLYVNRYIRLVPVPNSSGRRKLPEVQAELQQKSYILPATISGYGIIAKNQSYSSVEILKVDAFITDWMLCKELLKDSYNISESHMCIEDPSPERRISDVGGPLIFDSSVVGIALYKEWKKPTDILLFTNVLSYWTWIQRQIESRKNTVPFKKDVPFNDTRQTVHFEKEKVSLDNELLHHVILKNASSGLLFCGGSIINPLFVLTAAECVVGRQSENITVLANFTDTDGYGVIVRNVTKIIIHNDYNPSDPWRNDIALLKLNKCYRHKHILKGVLPDRHHRTLIALLPRPLRLKVSVSGFGIIAEKQPESTRYMKYYTYMYEWTYCKELFEGIPYNISQSQICAHDPFNFADVNDPRTSDVGSPVVFGRNTVLGIALSANWNTCSHNTKCPLLFTNTASYSKWIRTQIRIHSGDLC